MCICREVRGEIEDELGHWLVRILKFVTHFYGPLSRMGCQYQGQHFDNLIKAAIYKIEADHLRYMAEISLDGLELGKIDRLYSEALAAITGSLESDTDEFGEYLKTLQAGIALNHSVFCYETLHEPERAIRIARDGFDKFKNAGGRVEEGVLGSTIQRLRDNITLWISIDDKQVA
jgi:hypothetical protein